MTLLDAYTSTRHGSDSGKLYADYDIGPEFNEEILTDFSYVSKPTGSHDIKSWAVPSTPYIEHCYLGTVSTYAYILLYARLNGCC